MYFPYFRGKQFELIVIREMAELLADSNFTPIIEPVRENLSGLQRALNEIVKYEGRAIVTINPQYGDLQYDYNIIEEFLSEKYTNNDHIKAGILLDSDTSVRAVDELHEKNKHLNPVFIHNGFTHPKELAEKFGKNIKNIDNFFIEKTEQIMYRRHFNGSTRVLLNDGFKQMRNADYPKREEFSDLHLTYKDRNLDGFGDFLIVGDSYSDTGGPAYAVAIHLTFINAEQDDVMYIYHFVSDDKDTPTDPAGKFAQALKKLVVSFDSGESMLYETKAIKEYKNLHKQGHFPGLGVVKKLSMMHHLETLATYYGKNI